jgi:hypothetical protein
MINQSANAAAFVKGTITENTTKQRLLLQEVWILTVALESGGTGDSRLSPGWHNI